MGLGGLSFAAGLGTGYMNQSRYQDRQDQWNREQARLDAEFQMRKELADEALAERKRDNDLKRAVGEASKEASVTQSATLDTGDGPKVYDMPKGVDSQDVAASDARQFRRNAEETTGVDAPMPAVSSATTVNGKAYDSYSAGLKAAADYNDPAAKAARVAAAMEAYGRPDAAMDYRSKAEKFKQELYDAQRNALLRTGMEMIARGDLPGLLDAYNKHYNDGRTAVMSTDGKLILQKDKDGVTVGELPVGTRDDMLLAFRDLVFPDKRAESQATTRSQAAAEANKVHIVPMGGMAITGGGKRIAENENNLVPYLDANGNQVLGEDGKPLMVRPGAGGKVDHFDNPKWVDVFKASDGEYKVPDPSGVLPSVPSASMRAARLGLLQTMRQTNAIDPLQAQSISSTLENDLISLANKQLANARAQDKGSKLTFEDAVSRVYQSPAWQARAKAVIESAAPQQPTAPAGRPAGRTSQPSAPSAPSSGGASVSQSDQGERDANARGVLEAELKNQTSRLSALQEEFNGGKPTPRGDEANNPQKYARRVEELKASIARAESDISGISKELGRSTGGARQAPPAQAAQPAPQPAQAAAPAKPVALAPIVPASKQGTSDGGGPNLLARGLPGPRVAYLERLAKSGQINAKESAELAQLKGRVGNEWWRGRATGEDSLAN